MAGSETQGSSGNSHLGAIVGWGSLTIATVVFIWFVMGQLAVGWEGRNDEALALTWNYQAPDLPYKLKDQTIAVGNAARAKGGFVGVFNWSAVQEKGPVYKVTLIWKDNSATRKANWTVDLENKTVAAADDEAQVFMKPVATTAGG